MNAIATPIRILVADDHLVYRLGMRTLLSTEPGIQLVGEASTGDEAVRLFRETMPDIVLLDLRMPKGGGISVVKQIISVKAMARILIITSYEMEEEIFQIMQAGASGYMLKDLGREILLEAIFAVHAGRRWMSERIASRIADRSSRKQLTPREVEIAHYIVRGLTNAEIGSVLTISESTVKNHMYSLMDKLEAADRTEAATACLTRGIVHTEEF